MLLRGRAKFGGGASKPPNGAAPPALPPPPNPPEPVAPPLPLNAVPKAPFEEDSPVLEEELPNPNGGAAKVPPVA